jgi:hypothetical protein
MPDLTESTELVSVDDNIDEIAHEALEEARRVEEAEKYRKTPGPVIPPTPRQISGDKGPGIQPAEHAVKMALRPLPRL